jgi:hypothetical protein
MSLILLTKLMVCVAVLGALATAASGNWQASLWAVYAALNAFCLFRAERALAQLERQ